MAWSSHSRIGCPTISKIQVAVPTDCLGVIRGVYFMKTLFTRVIASTRVPSFSKKAISIELSISSGYLVLYLDFSLGESLNGKRSESCPRECLAHYLHPGMDYIASSWL